MAKIYAVSIPIEGRVEVSVMAESKEEAIRKAVNKASSDIDRYLDQFELLDENCSVFEKIGEK